MVPGRLQLAVGKIKVKITLDGRHITSLKLRKTYLYTEGLSRGCYINYLIKDTVVTVRLSGVRCLVIKRQYISIQK